MLSRLDVETSAPLAAVSRPTSLIVVSPPSPQPSSVAVLDTPTITNIVLSLDNLQSGVPTKTTPTVTPTTLKNIEQIFEVAPIPECHSNQAGFVPPSIQPISNLDISCTSATTYVQIDLDRCGGGITTLANNKANFGLYNLRVSPIPISSNVVVVEPSQPVCLAISPPNKSQIDMPVVSNQNILNINRRGGTKRNPSRDMYAAEEDERRHLRRERNKEAAARCRQRRVDLTEQLQGETDMLICKRKTLQQEIQNLQKEREDLEYFLAAHKPTCKKINMNFRIKMSEAISKPPTPLADVVKNEPHDFQEQYEPHNFQERNESHDFQEQKESVLINDSFNVCQLEKEHEQIDFKSRPSRPTSLAFMKSSKPRVVTELGVPIDTPSNALRDLNFESIIEGSGLTPLKTGLTPTAVPLAPVSLETPVVHTAYSVTQPKSRNVITIEVASPNSGTTKLVSL